MVYKKRAGDVTGTSGGKKKKGKANDVGVILTKSSHKNKYNNLATREISTRRYPDQLVLYKS